MELEENDPVFPEKPKYLAVPHQSHSVRILAATPKTHPSPFSPAEYMLPEGNRYASLRCTFWGDKFLKMIVCSLPLWISDLRFLSLWLCMLLSGNCSSSLGVCRAPWKIIEMKDAKICKLLLLFLSASWHRIWSVHRQSGAAFLSTVVMFAAWGPFRHNRNDSRKVSRFSCLKLSEFVFHFH